MEFKLTRSQIEIVKAARDFAKSEFTRELSAELDRQSAFPHALYQKAAELGFTSLQFEEDYLGGGLGYLETVLMGEALCCRDSTLGSALMLSGYGADLLSRFGADPLKSRFLTGVAEGRMLSGAVMEFFPADGQDHVPSLAACEEDAHWVINGTATAVINGGLAGFYCLLCRTDPDAQPQKATSMILVAGDQKGITTVDTGQKLGLRMTAVTDLKFEAVRVPRDHTIGMAGDGIRQLASFNSESCLLLAALGLGTAQGVFDRTVQYVKQRQQFGRKIAAFQVTRHKLAGMAMKIEQARMLTYRAAWQQDQKTPDVTLSAMAKLAATGAALDCAHEAIQLHGGYGFSTEYEVERFCRDAKTLHLLGGKPGVINDQIADTIIGKIR
ncbi:MAG: acyl-CoA dehydrogenase family protein [bacterium]